MFQHDKELVLFVLHLFQFPLEFRHLFLELLLLPEAFHPQLFVSLLLLHPTQLLFLLLLDLLDLQVEDLVEQRFSFHWMDPRRGQAELHGLCGRHHVSHLY